MKSKEKADGAAWERFGAANLAMQLSTLQLFTHLHAHFTNDSLHTLEEEKLMGWKAVRKLQSAALAPYLLYASLSHDVPEPLPIERPTVQCPVVIEMGDEEKAVRISATSVDVGLSLKAHPPLEYRAGVRGSALYKPPP